MDDPIFVVGLPRSGSTLWENIIAKNEKILRLGEILFLTPWRKDFRYFLKKNIGDLLIDQNIERMIELIFSKQHLNGINSSFWLYNIPSFNEPSVKSELYNKLIQSDRTLASVFKIFIEVITHFSGYNKCCIAFPVYINHVPDLFKWYPNCKVIHVTRDPRAIAISKTNDPSGTAIRIKKYPQLGFFIRKIIILFVIIQYVWTSFLHLKFCKIKNYALFHYEDLLVDPKRVIKELCEFLEIDFVPQMLNPDKAMKSSVTGKKYKGLKKNAATHWQNVISPFEKKIINLLTKGSMKRLEYDYQNHPIYNSASQS